MTAQRQRFPARTDALPRVSAFVERRCRELGAGRLAALRLVLVAEEIFLNTVLHGYAGGSGRRVSLTVRGAGREVELVAEDDAPAFDPFRRVRAAPAHGDLRSAVPGGLGRLLVTGVSCRHRYQRVGRRNRVTVAVSKLRARGPRSERHRKK